MRQCCVGCRLHIPAHRGQGFQTNVNVYSSRRSQGVHARNAVREADAAGSESKMFSEEKGASTRSVTRDEALPRVSGRGAGGRGGRPRGGGGGGGGGRAGPGT